MSILSASDFWKGRVNLPRLQEHLTGILHGVAIDAEVNARELAGVADWLSQNPHVAGHQPFADLFERLSEICADGHVSVDELAEVERWIDAFLHDHLPDRTDIVAGLRRLGGVLHGIAVDHRVSQQEAIDLREWLEDNQQLAGHWQFELVAMTLRKVLADGVLTKSEADELLELCRNFADDLDTSIGGAHSMRVVCNYSGPLSFAGRTYVVTGKFESPRKVVEAGLLERGARIVPVVSRAVDYVVVGAVTASAWKFSTYGNKIADAMRLQQTLGRPNIVAETVLTAALQTENARR